MIKPSVQPRSLRPVWEDFTQAKECCCACRHKLTSGKAVYFISEGKVIPLGPVCASKYALPGSLRGLPDLTQGIMYEQGLVKDKRSRKTGQMAHVAEATQIPRLTEDDRNINAAIRYVLLRGDKLSQMGFSGLDWQPVTELYESYLKGSLDQSALKRVVAAMQTHETNLPTRKFSLANLEACYAYGRLLKEIKDCGKWLPNEDFYSRINLEKQLKTKLFLDDAQRAKVETLARRYLAKRPERVNARFTAFRPEHLQNRLSFGP